MNPRFLKYLAAACLMIPLSAHGEDFAPDASRIVSDPTYLPLQGQIFGSTDYQWRTTTQDVFNAAGTLTKSQRLDSNPLSQAFEYGVTDDFTLRFNMGYDPSATTKTTLADGTTSSRINLGWTDPNFGFTYRVLDQRSNPVSFDLRGSYSPDVFGAKSATVTQDGSVALGAQSFDLGASLGRETRFFTIAAMFDALNVGHRSIENPLNGANVDINSLWTYSLRIATQTRLTDRFSFNAGAGYTLGHDADLFNEASDTAYASHVGATANLNAALNYQFVPNIVVGSLEFQHNFSGGRNNIYAVMPASDWQIHNQSGDVLGVRLRYVLQ